jgi:hypothetical protein
MRGRRAPGVVGPPYDVPAGPEQVATNEPGQDGCIRVVCAQYSEYESDPKYCCIGGYGEGERGGHKDQPGSAHPIRL